MRSLSTTFVVSFLFVACAGKPAPADTTSHAGPTPPIVKTSASEPAPARLSDGAYEQFGTGIHDQAPAVDVVAAVAQPDQFTGKTVRLSGTISGVCQTKGCWMTIGSSKPPVVVKFKDYAFFVPKDAAGRNAIVEGTLTFKQETVEETKHLLEDAGKHAEAAKVTEGRKLYHFMASGVAIQKPAQ